MPKPSTLLLSALLFSSLGMWGCTHQKNDATNARIRDLETRHARLEEDYRALSAASEQNRKNVVRLESERDGLTRQLAEVRDARLERDDLRRQLTERTNERDGAQAQLAQFSDDLRSLLERVEFAANAMTGSHPASYALPRSRH